MLPAIENQDVENFYTTFHRDVETFRDQLPQLLKRFPGEFVAIFNGKIVDHKPNYNDLVATITLQFPGKFVFVERIAPKEKISVDMDTLEG